MLHQSFSDSVRTISIDREALLSALREIAGQIYTDHPAVKSVRVFGSVARGDQVGTSDVDVLIILPGDEPVFLLEQIRRFYPYFDLPVGVDLLVYSEGQLAHRLQAQDPFMTRLWQESEAL